MIDDYLVVLMDKSGNVRAGAFDTYPAANNLYETALNDKNITDAKLYSATLMKTKRR